jgi:hypothetical protein
VNLLASADADDLFAWGIDREILALDVGDRAAFAGWLALDDGPEQRTIPPVSANRIWRAPYPRADSVVNLVPWGNTHGDIGARMGCGGSVRAWFQAPGHVLAPEFPGKFWSTTCKSLKFLAFYLSQFSR